MGSWGEERGDRAQVAADDLAGAVRRFLDSHSQASEVGLRAALGEWDRAVGHGHDGPRERRHAILSHYGLADRQGQGA